MKKDESNELLRLMALATRFDAQRRPEQLVHSTSYPDLSMLRVGSRRHQWESLKWSIDQASEHGVNGLTGLAVTLSRIIVADGLRGLLMDAREHQGCGISVKSLLWPAAAVIKGEATTMRDLLQPMEEALVVDTRCTAVIPAPWERRRTIRALANLGEKRSWGAWRQDKRNHHGVAWSPWPLLWVDNGNHSTLASLVMGGGKFKCSEHLDASALLNAVTTDGMNWIRTDTNQAFGHVKSLPMAAIFLIGKQLARP